MYITEEFYANYIGKNAPVPFERLEDQAVLMLEEYCYAFPNETEWETLEDPTKTYISKAIAEQIDLLSEFTDGGSKIDPNGFSLGRFSIQANNSDSEITLSDSAKRFMKLSGICKFGVYDNVECGCLNQSQ